MNDEILYDVADGVGTITLNRPQARNALTFAMYEGWPRSAAIPRSTALRRFWW
jgi:enoyl-CoA hydratase/carnithine racemase